MAFISSQATLSYSCFTRDELEQMLLWRVMQEGNFMEVKHGAYAHLYDANRRMHWLQYIEDIEGEEESSESDANWRLDLHIDGGRYTVRCDVPLEPFFADVDARFSNATPILFNGKDFEFPLIVELVNKNMLDEKRHSEEPFDINMSFAILDLTLFANRQEWIASLAESGEIEEPPEVMQLGMVVEQSMREGEEPDEDVISVMKGVAEEFNLNPITLVNLAGTVTNVGSIDVGNDILNYDVTLETHVGEFRVIVPESFIEADDIEPGVFLSTMGFFSALYLNDASDRNENVVQFPQITH